MVQLSTWLKNKKYAILGGLFAFLAIGLFALTLKATWVIHAINIGNVNNQQELFNAFGKKGNEEVFRPLELPQIEPERLDILILGIRGIGKEFGGLLTDTLLLLSLDKKTSKAAMISIPRDLYITLPYNGEVKINEVYALGFDKGGEKLALNLVKTVVSQINGVYVDAVVRVDFEGFKKLVDVMGGVDIYLPQPFIETEQWKGAGGFSLPRGWNHLDGEKALFFVRSRFATSDFDRARRQQEVVLALKQKIIDLGILSNPARIYRILDIIGNHVKTDFAFNVSEAITLANSIDYRNVKRLVLTTQNYLYHSTAPNGAYILLPKDQTFKEMQRAIKHIFTDNPLNPLPSEITIKKVDEKTLNNHYPLQNATTTSQTP